MAQQSLQHYSTLVLFKLSLHNIGRVLPAPSCSSDFPTQGCQPIRGIAQASHCRRRFQCQMDLLLHSNGQDEAMKSWSLYSLHSRGAASRFWRDPPNCRSGGVEVSGKRRFLTAAHRTGGDSRRQTVPYARSPIGWRHRQPYRPAPSAGGRDARLAGAPTAGTVSD